MLPPLTGPIGDAAAEGCVHQAGSMPDASEVTLGGANRPNHHRFDHAAARSYR